MQNGVSPLYEAFYIESMLFDADLAVGAFEEVERLEQRSDWLQKVTQRGFLAYLQIVIQHSAALSRYFWPARQAHNLRGEQLRRAFNVTDVSPLKGRELRNALEHLDERLDNFLGQQPLGNVLPEFVGPMPDRTGVATHFFRAYYPDEKIFELLGVRYEIEPIVKEVVRIHQLLQSMRRTGRF